EVLANLKDATCALKKGLGGILSLRTFGEEDHPRPLRARQHENGILRWRHSSRKRRERAQWCIHRNAGVCVARPSIHRIGVDYSYTACIALSDINFKIRIRSAPGRRNRSTETRNSRLPDSRHRT